MNVSFRAIFQISAREIGCPSGGNQLISVYSHVFGQPAKKEHSLDNVKVSGNAWDTNLVAASGVRFIIVDCVGFVPHLSLPEFYQLELERLRWRGLRNFPSSKPIPPYSRNFPVEASGYNSIGPKPLCSCPGHCMVALQ